MSPESISSPRLGATHDALRAWCSAQRRKLTGLSWEIYGDPDPRTGHFHVAVYSEVAAFAGALTEE
jgi:hypothetical protein